MSASTFIKISSASRQGKARFRGFLGLPQGERTLTPLRTKMTLITPETKRGTSEGRRQPHMLRRRRISQNAGNDWINAQQRPLLHHQSRRRFQRDSKI